MEESLDSPLSLEINRSNNRGTEITLFYGGRRGPDETPCLSVSGVTGGLRA